MVNTRRNRYERREISWFELSENNSDDSEEENDSNFEINSSDDENQDIQVDYEEITADILAEREEMVSEEIIAQLEAAATAAAKAAVEAQVADAKKKAVYVTTPYAGDINPGTSNGIKMFNAATQSRDTDEKMQLKVSKSKEFIEAMKDDANAYCWGILTASIEIDGEKYDILKDFPKLNVESVRKSMGKTFYSKSDEIPTVYTQNRMFDIDPADDEEDRKVFHDRVRANMIGQRILGSLNRNSLKQLKSKKRQYQWTSSTGETFYDGPTMLQICIEIVRPSTRVGVTSLKDQIRACKLSNFGNNVHEMLNNISSLKEQIEDQGGTHDDIIYDTFAALMTSKNERYCTFISNLQDEWDTGAKDYTLESLSEKCVVKYNNMVKAETWNRTTAKDSKIVALTTQVEKLQEQLNNNKYNSHGGGGGGGNKNSGVKLRVEEWRLKKTSGDKVFKDGKQWYWCPHQHNDGKGMYVTHKPEEHTTWKDCKKNGQRFKPGGSNDSQKGSADGGKGSQSKKNMTLSDNMKAAMVSKFKCSETDAAALWTAVCKDSNFQGN